MPKKRTITSEEKCALLKEALEDRKAEDITVLDLRDKDVMVADFFVICTGLAIPHIRALAEHVIEAARDALLPQARVEGEAVAEWVLLDFGDVVVHIMNAESRERYKLEQFWSTPRPKGALPPRPGDNPPSEESGPLDLDFDDEAFFADADTEVEPIDEDELE